MLKSKLFASAKKFLTRKEEGASLAEYAMLLAIVTAALITIITTFAGTIGSIFTSTGTELSTAAGS